MTRWREFWRDPFAVRFYGAIAVAVVILVAGVGWALAHEGWRWIADNRNFIDRNGVHCCSEDCSPANTSDFTEEQDGIRYKDGQKIYYGRPDGMRGGAYWSQEPNPPVGQRWWICMRGGRLNCVFRPQDGS
jgi:hypothetical protein